MQFDHDDFEEDLMAHDTFRNPRMQTIFPDAKQHALEVGRIWTELIVGLFALAALWGGVIVLVRYWGGY